MNKGVLFLIVGNSGSGKDSIIEYVTNKVPGLRKIKRYITRAPSNTENYHSINAEDFNKSDYFICWQAYDKLYGVGNEVLEGLQQGRNYIVNISRKAIKKIMERWDNTYLIECVVPIMIITRRLNYRGRESPEEIQQRVQRALTAPLLNPDCTLDTSHPDITIAGDKLVKFMKDVLN